MAKKKQGAVAKPKAVAQAPASRSLVLAEKGITTLMECAEFSLATATDVIRGAVTASAANASATNIGKALKAVEIQQKFGPKNGAAMRLAS